MTKYQLIYNGNKCYPLCDTIEQAESYKQKSAEQWPEIKVEIKKQEEQDQEENAPAELSSADRILRTTTELPDFWAKESYNEDLL
jgi:hypothetical protein